MKSLEISLLYFLILAVGLLASQVPHSTPKQSESAVDLFVEYLEQITSETVWITESQRGILVEAESKWKSIVSNRLALQVKIDNYCFAAQRLGAKLPPKDAVVLKYFARLFRVGFSPKFVSDFNNFIGSLKPKNKLNMDPKVFNDFPSILKPLADVCGDMIADMVEQEFIGRVYQNPVADLHIPALERKFIDLFIEKDRSQTLRILFQGCLQRSKKALEMWHNLYYHVVFFLGEGVSGFERMFGEKERPFFGHLISIYKARKPVNVIFDDDFEDVASFISKASFKTVPKDQVRSVPYEFLCGPIFRKYIESLLVKGHLAYHPNNGKVLLTNIPTKKQRGHIAKLFKVMICLNLTIPRLALTEAEYEYANKLNGQPLFVYYPEMIEEVNKVTDNIVSHFQYSRTNYSTKPDYKLGVILNPILCDPELIESLLFMLVGKSMDGTCLSLSNFDYTNEKILVTVGAPDYRVTIHPNLTREEYAALFEKAELDKEAPIRTFRSTLLESDDGKQDKKSEASSQTDALSSIDDQPISTKDIFEPISSTVVDFLSDTAKSAKALDANEQQSLNNADCGRALGHIIQQAPNFPPDSLPAWNFLKSLNESHEKIILSEPRGYYPDYETYCELIKEGIVDLLTND